MQRANQTNLFLEISRKVSRLFPGNFSDLLQRVTVSTRKHSQNGNSFVNLDSSRFPGIPQNFPEISQKSPGNLPENSWNFPEFSNIAFLSIFVIFWTTTNNDTSENLKKYQFGLHLGVLGRPRDLQNRSHEPLNDHFWHT